MKKSINLNSTEWCDVVFQNKNKAYGAYALRQTSSKRHILAFGVIILFVVAVSALPTLLNAIESRTAKVDTGGIDDIYVVEVYQAPEEVEVPKITPPEVKPTMAMDKFTPPVIVDNNTEIDEADEVPDMDKIANPSGNTIGAYSNPDGSKEKDALPPGPTTPAVVVEKPEPKKPFVNVEQMPSFPGGPTEMMKFIQRELKYPPAAQELGMQGRAIIRFVVSPTGAITDVEVMKGFDKSCDAEAMRVVKAMPKWIPGKQNGREVSVYFTLPVVFRLQ